MKKGFTLIELLAVILILGIIALIAVPQVTNVIDKSHKGAAETSAEHYVGAVNTEIALTKLDTDSSNDIKDGIVGVNNIKVDMTGETPVSGNVVVISGTVKSAEVEVNGKTVLCDTKGKCTAIDKFVYWAETRKATNLSEYSDEKPSNKAVYLKYAVLNGEIVNEQVCIYSIDKEFCISNGEYEVTMAKIYDYAGIDKSNTSRVLDDNLAVSNPQDNSKYCIFIDSYVQCGFGDYSANINRENGEVAIRDIDNDYACDPSFGKCGSIN